MNKFRTAYIAFTALFCVAIFPGAIMDIAQPEMVVEVMNNIGLPLYVITLIGIWKILGVVALALPRFERVNEWAYAGFFFDLTGAAWCHWAPGDTTFSVVMPLFFLLPLGASYVLRDMVRAGAGVAGDAAPLSVAQAG